MTVGSLSRPWLERGRPATESGDAARIALLFALHVVGAILMFHFEWVAKGHFFATVLVGLALVAVRSSPATPVLVASYVASAEVLWRMCEGYVFWEQGKYLLILFLVIGYLRSSSHGSVVERLAVSLPLLLTPSALLTFNYLGFTAEARQAIAFNLAGPVALAIAALVLARLDLTELDPRTVLLTILLPILGISAIVLYTALSADSIFFTGESSLELSGFYGPNQVSAVLGLAALCAMLLGLAARGRHARVAWIVLATLLLSQATLTFSRGGVFAAVFALAAALIHLVTDHRRRRALLGITAIVAAASILWLVPKLNQFTAGSLADRYSEWELSGREEIMWGDLELFRDNPWLGVGTGLSPHFREMRRGRPAHTEFTRLLAEHGLFGLLASIIVLAIPWIAYRRAPTLTAKAWVACFAAWALLGMVHAATRIAAISLVYGLAVVNWPTPARSGQGAREVSTEPDGTADGAGD